MTSPTEKKGRTAENYSTKYLRDLGWEIRERNFRSGYNEIDIIAVENNTLVFVEVKWRKNEKFGFPEEFVSRSQIKRIGRAAEDYIFKVDWKGNIRLDIIALLGNNEDDFDLEHFRDVDF